MTCSRLHSTEMMNFGTVVPSRGFFLALPLTFLPLSFALALALPLHLAFLPLPSSPVPPLVLRGRCAGLHLL